MDIRFPCPQCGNPCAVEFNARQDLECPACQSPISLSQRRPPDGCSRCGNVELYRQKDFPQWLGMGLLAAACGLFFIFAILYQYTIAWTILLGSAAIDCIIYWLVGDVVMCYRCQCQHRGGTSRGVDPFEIAIAEKYRQERLRKEHIAAAQTNR